MNEKQAGKEGLMFTGIYGDNKGNNETVKAQAADIRKRGFRAVVVPCDGGYGCAVYAEKRYFTDRQVTDLEKRIAMKAERLAMLKAEYEQAVAAIENETADMAAKVKSLKATL